MAQITVISSNLAGKQVSYTAAASGGDTFANNGQTIFKVKNGSAAAITVTVASQQLCNFGFDHDLSVSVAAGEERVIGIFSRERFNNNDGNVSVTYSAAASVTVCALSLI